MDIKEISTKIHTMIQEEKEENRFDFELEERKSTGETWYFGFKVFRGIDLTRGIVSAYGRPEHDILFSIFNNREEIEQKLKDKLSFYWKI